MSPRPYELTDPEVIEWHRAEQERRETERRERWLSKCGIPKRLQDATLDSQQRTPAIVAARDYFGLDVPRPPDDAPDDQVFYGLTEYGHGRCLVLAGPTGVGKTYAACAALLNVTIGRFWYFPALCGALLDPERRSDALRIATSIRPAVFDDMGVEYVKDGGLVETFLDEIIWTRESERLATIITTNLTPDALKDRWSSRIVDRLRGEWGLVVEIPGESLR